MATTVNLIDLDHLYISDSQNLESLTKPLIKSLINVPESLKEKISAYSNSRERCRSVNYQLEPAYIELIKNASYLTNSLNFEKNRSLLVWSKQTTSSSPRLDIAAAFYNLTAISVKSAQKSTNLQEKAQFLGKSLYYIQNSLFHSKQIRSISSPVLNSPNLIYNQTFLSAQMYETLAAFQWQKSSFQGFPAWSKFVMSAIEFYEKAERFDAVRAGCRSQELLKLLFLTSAHFNSQQKNHKQARCDAEHAASLGAVVNFAEFFDSPAAEISVFTSYQIDLEKKFKEWKVEIELDSGDVFLDKEASLCIAEVQRLCDFGQRFEEVNLKNQERKVQIESELVEFVKICKFQQFSDQIQQAVNSAQEGEKIVSESRKFIEIYKEILRSDNENLSKIGAKWDSKDYQKHIQLNIQDLETVVSVGVKLPECVNFLSKYQVQDIVKVINNIQNQQEKIVEVQKLLAEYQDIQAVKFTTQEIVESTELDLVRKNAKQIADKLPITTDNSKFEAILSQYEAVSNALNLNSQDLEIAKFTASAILTVQSVTSFILKGNEKVEKHSNGAEKTFNNYIQQVQEKWSEVKNGNGITIEWKEM